MNRATGAVQWWLPGVGNAGLAGIPGPFGDDLRALRVSGSTLYAGSQSGWLIAYDLTRRKEGWRFALSSSDETFRPTIAGGVVYEETAGGGLEAITSGGKLKWIASIGDDRFIGAPAVGPDRIFLSGAKGFWAIAR